MAPSTIKKAIDAVKDQTSIGIAKVAGTVAPDLEVLIVKATAHDPEPADERYIREILNLTSFSKNYVNACVLTISKRFSKTHNWIVALKALLLVHRLLVDGGFVFQEEILHATRGGARILNMSGFRDEACSKSWDQSGFVRYFGLYLDQRVEYIVFERRFSGVRVYGELRDQNPDHGSSYYGDGNEGSGRGPKREVTPLRELRPDRVLEKTLQLERLLDRFLSCRPTGAAKNNRMVLVALYPLVKESFKLYVDLCEAMAALLGRFLKMEYKDCVQAFKAYVYAGKQIDELVRFYDWCKETGVTRSSEYPEVQRITGQVIETLEGFLKERAKNFVNESGEEENPVVVKKETESDPNHIKALPPPENITSAPPRVHEHKHPQPQQETEDLVDLKDDNITADDHGNQLALALFSTPQPPNTNGSWDAFMSSGKPDWESALVESASNLSQQKAALGGGFDQLILNGMYDQSAVRQQVSRAQLSGGSGSSVALLASSGAPVLALPAPDGSVKAIGEDPFAASLSVAPPSYVQVADMEKKQQLFVQEQQRWQQYGRDGMQGQVGLAKNGGGFGGYYGGSPQQMMPYGMAPIYSMEQQPGGYYPAPY